MPPLRSKRVITRLPKRAPRAETIHPRRPRLRRHHAILLLLLEAGLHRLLLLLGCAGELLLVEERVVARLRGVEFIQALAGAVDKGAGCGVLGRDAEIARVAEGVHAFAGGEEGVETGVLRVGVFLRGGGSGGGLIVRDGVVGGLGELGGCFLLGQGVEGWWASLLRLCVLEGGGEGVVGASLGGFERLWLLLLACCPGVVAARLRGAEGLLLLLELIAKVIGLGVGVVLGVESSLLRLDALLSKVIRLLLRELRLIEASLLGLKAVLEASLLLL